jgi:hypothetical protein
MRLAGVKRKSGRVLVWAFAVLCPVLAANAAAQESAIPIFGPNSNTAWIPARPAGDDFIPPDSGPGPVMSQKDHPYVPNGQGRVSYRVADSVYIRTVPLVQSVR